ncbi:MAG: hypothetical protein OQK35_03170 [Alphaproteobacteria bacterium]|nr:hypothetical protein [Rhodospirillales bacterium]MCW9045312.1 hypothetical protein [Alphaproteobacteria bacterium]
MIKSNFKLFFLVVFLAGGVLLTGCAAVKPDVELPKNAGEGSDEMKISPCACNELDYDGRGFQWRV